MRVAVTNLPAVGMGPTGEIFEHMLRIEFMSAVFEIDVGWVSFNDNSIVVQLPESILTQIYVAIWRH